MRQIAKGAKVSPTTVAHVLNRTQGAYVAEPTRQRVLQAAQAMGYQEALLSQSIKAPLRHLGVVVGDNDQARADAMEIFEGIRQEAITHDYITVLLPMAPEVSSNYSSDKAVESILHFHRTKLMDGFVIDKSCFLSDPMRALDASGVPVITVNGTPTRHLESQKPILSAVVDNRAGGRMATEHLLACGHRRIALLTRPWAAYPEGYRPYQVSQIVRGYHDALHAAGVAQDPRGLLDAHAWDKRQTYAAVDQLLALDQPPTAIVASDDAIALMIIHALLRRGRRVPRDVSVVGYGDWSQAARLCEPDLTSVHTDLRATGVLAARMIIQRLAGADPVEPQAVLTPRLNVRGSTAPPPAPTVPPRKRRKA